MPNPSPDLDARRRVIIENVTPEIDCGRFPAKRVVGDEVQVEADIFTDGHDSLSAVLLYRHTSGACWEEAVFEPLVNDRWTASFSVGTEGRYLYTVEAWVDPFKSWRRDLEKRIDADQDVSVDLAIGAALVQDAAGRASEADEPALSARAAHLSNSALPTDDRVQTALSEHLAELVARYPDRSTATRFGVELPLIVDRKRARFSAWYEFFPRSCTDREDRHGTFADCEQRLDYVQEMGFDVVYLPPIHPIGASARKGKNNALVAEAGDVGVPWAIGSPEGGHDALNSQLGTLDDFRRFVSHARERGIEVALDFALQCSPDHPWVKTHPEWFRKRPDGSIQYAENPPKKYQDIFPLNFDSDATEAIYRETLRVLRFWIDQGISIFRVDNPHTKPFAFWERLLGEIKSDRPDVLFLAEAFTRPKVMHRLAKLGFTQSYTYFAWRNTKYELTEYLRELTQTKLREFFRPNFWPNTPDILTEYLQTGGRAAFMVRLVLAATLSSSYGIYGPAFELAEARPREPGSEEYLDSEKYQIRVWNLDDPRSLRELIALVNRIRAENEALQSNDNLQFHEIDNDQLICYSKTSADGANSILAVVNLDPHHTQSGWTDLDLASLGLPEDAPFQTHDLLSGARYLWHGKHNFVQLAPDTAPAHLFLVRRHVRSERDFDYYM